MPFLPVYNRQFLAYFAKFQKMSDSVKFSIFHQDLKKTRFINFCDLDHMLKSLVVYQTFTKLNKKQYSKCWQMALSHISSVQFSSVPQSCPTLCNPMNCSTPGFPVHHHSCSLLKLMSIKSVMPPNHLVLFCPILLLPLIFPSFWVFSRESVLWIRWPKYWSFSFSIIYSIGPGSNTLY